MNPDELTRQWADVRHAAAFSGGDIFHKAHPEVSAKKIKLEICLQSPLIKNIEQRNRLA